MLRSFLERNAMTLMGIVCIAFSFFFQMYIPINANSAWHLQVAVQLLQGKQLYKDIIEVNLPLIYYLRTIPVWLSHWLYTPLWWASVLFNFGLCLLSYYLCMWVIYRSSYRRNKFFVEIHKFILALLIFVLPFWLNHYNTFGEKEHLFLVLVLPYVFTMFCTKSFWEKDHTIHAIIGIIAGVGICIKPYFVIVFLTVELYRLLYRRHIIPLIRIEPLAIGLVGLTFLVAVAAYFPYYITDVIPMASRVYQYKSWFYFFLSPFLMHKSIIFICMIPLWVEKKVFERYYYFLMIACVLCASLLLSHFDYYFFPAFALCIVIMITRLAHVLWIKGWWNKKHFFSLYIGVTFGLIFCYFLCTSLLQLYHRTNLSRYNQYDGLSAYIHQYKEKGPVFMLGVFNDVFPLITQSELPWNYGISTALTLANSDRYTITHPTGSERDQALIASYNNEYIRVLMKGLNEHPPVLFIVNDHTPYPYQSLDHWIGHIERHKKFPEFAKFWEQYKLLDTIPRLINNDSTLTNFSVYVKK